MKKICFVLPKFAPENIGGAELQVYYLAKELTKMNFQVHYIREKSNRMLKNDMHEDIILHTIPHQRFFFMQFLNFPFLWTIMKQVKADYWYVRVSMWNLAIVQMLSKFSGGKVIWACSHDREVSVFMPRTTGIAKRMFERLEHSYFIKSLKKVNYRLVQTKKQQRLLNENYRLNSLVLQNAHPIPIFAKQIKEDAVLWVANMRDFKRPQLFLELAKKLVIHNIKCYMIGSAGGRELMAEINVVQQAYPNFQYLGPLPVEDVYKYLQRCKVFVNTSSEEGFPNTFIQAWLSGVPVVTLGVDPSGIIKNNKIGIITSSTDEMKDAIVQLVNNKTQWLMYSQKAKEYATAHFDIAAYVKRFISLTEIAN